MPRATKHSKLVTCHWELASIKSHNRLNDHVKVTLKSHVRLHDKLKDYISTTTMPIATKCGRIVTYREGLPLIKLQDH